MFINRQIIIALCVMGFAILSACSNKPSSPHREPPVELVKISDHFRAQCYVERDAAVLDTILAVLEANYSSITDHLQCQSMSRVTVYIYPDIDSFHQASTDPNGPDVFVAQCVNATEIRMVSPLNPGPFATYCSMLKAVVHEFVHAVTNTVNIELMYDYNWLFEAVACYESGMIPQPDFIRQLIDSNQVPTIYELEHGALYEYGGYQVVYTIAQFVVSEYGYDVLADYIRNPNDYAGVFTDLISRYQFQTAWLEYIDRVY